VPEKEGLDGQTFWVWPESLWAPIAFTKTYLKRRDNSHEDWIKWWFDPDARVYQFVGEDNIYFYAVAEMGLFMALNEIAGREPLSGLPIIVPNRHLLYCGKKASSSSEAKPPGAAEFLNFYTNEQLRMHFAHIALQHNSGSFFPKAMFEGQDGFDATLAEGNILTNVYNRLIRSCFYSMQKHFNGNLPTGEPEPSVTETARATVEEYEWAMYRFEFSKIIDILDVYLRDSNKLWSAEIKLADAMDKEGQTEEALKKRAVTLLNAFHAVRTAATLLHPFAPEGTERVAEFLGVGDNLWNWNNIHEPLNFFIKQDHQFKFLEPKVDFFFKHPSQL